jgi:alpha-tubulin suppressor-like RCC1 family protein
MAIITSEAEGLLYTMGRGNDGQLGHGDRDDLDRFRPVTTLDRVTSVSCGNAQTAVIANGGNVYTFGYGERGQLGIGKMDFVPHPVMVRNVPNAISVSCATGRTAIVASKDGGTLYMCGAFVCEYIENEDVDHSGDDDQLFPGKIKGIKDVIFVSCASFHTALITKDGSLYTFGGNEDGELGHGDTIPRKIPTKVDAINGVTKVSCGDDYTAVIANRSLFVFGSNEDNQLECGNENQILSPREIRKRVIDISCGSSTNGIIVDESHY